MPAFVGSRLYSFSALSPILDAGPISSVHVFLSTVQPGSALALRLTGLTGDASQHVSRDVRFGKLTRVHEIARTYRSISAAPRSASSTATPCPWVMPDGERLDILHSAVYLGAGLVFEKPNSESDENET